MASRRTIKGALPSAEQLFYLQWARETQKRNIDLANQVLRQLVTLYASLLGGSIVFLKQEYLKPPYWGIVMVLLFLGLVLAFIGSMPYERHVDVRRPQDIKRHKQSALAWKRFFLWSAGLMGLSGFVVAILGITFG